MKKVLNLSLLALALLMAIPTSAVSPKREHRSSWVTTCWGNGWPTDRGSSATVAASQQSEAIKYLDLMQENGFNAVYLQVRGMSDAIYNSAYEPYSYYLTGDTKRAAVPTYDPLAFWVQECHKRGMEIYAWVNPYRIESSTTGSPWDIEASGIRADHPEWVMENDAGSASILNPGMTEVQNYIANVVKDIITKYDVDGVVFDDYFYLQNTSMSVDKSLYNSSGTSLSQADWRRENVNTMVRKVYNTIQSIKPYVKFGISPAGMAHKSASKYGVDVSLVSNMSDWQYDGIYSDPLAWLSEGTVDYISPQVYWKVGASTNPYEKCSEYWSDACADVFKRHFYSSHSISFLASESGMNSTSGWSEVAKQIQCNRDYDRLDAPGCVLYASENFTGKKNSGLAPYLKSYKFTQIALQPKMTWKSSTDPGKVTNLELSGSTLSWTGHSNVRYAIYAVPTGTSVDESDVSCQYLIGNPYETTFDVSGYTSGYRLGVSVVDRVGYEYAVAWYGENDDDPETLEIVNINTPVNGTTQTSTFTFGWSPITNTGVTYTLEVSTSSTFSNVNFSASTTGTSYSSSNFALVSGTTYYWRVKASKTGCATTTSWVASFTYNTDTGGGDDPITEVTKDPASYSTVDGYSIESLWIYSKNTNNFPSQLGGDQRGMAAAHGKVYVIQRDATLLVFNGETGAYETAITLTGDCLTDSDGNSLGYKCQDIFVDGAGNLCVSNMTLDVSTTPLTVCTIDVSTGATTRVFEATHDSATRIDFAAAYGNVTSSGGQIWAAGSNTNYVLRWTRSSSGSWTAAYTEIDEYYPSSVTSNSTAPRIMPVSTSQFILDGHNSAPALHTFKSGSTSTYVDGFDSNTDIAPTENNWNGTCDATLGGMPIFVYVSAMAPNTFTIVTNPSEYDFADMEKLWTVPESGLGSESNAYITSKPTAVSNSDGSVSLYLYTPNNGLACYKLTSSTTILPTLSTVTLSSPTGGTTVADGFKFSWSAISGATYTIEVSKSSSFSSIAFSATTSSNSYSSSNFNLADGTTYYWRVKAAKDGYTGSTSATASFKTPDPVLSAVTLTSPVGGVTVEEGFDFSWSAISGATYTLEASTLASFATIMNSATTTSTTYSSSNFELAEGTTYYWRVIAEKSGYQSSTSSVASFVTKKTSSDTPEVPSTPAENPDGGTYDVVNDLKIQNLWIYSTQTKNFPSQLGYDQRGMAAYKGNVYISERLDKVGYLHEFDGATGEYLRKITLTGDYLSLSDGSSLSLPCNDVFVDGAGHLCVSNLITSTTSSSQLTVCIVDENTGATTRVFESALSNRTGLRLDHCMVYGDITKEGAKVYAAVSSNSSSLSAQYKRRVYCWTRDYDHDYSNGSDYELYEDWTSSYGSTREYYPSSSSSSSYFGKAPRVLPIDGSRIIVDGDAIYPTLYTYKSSMSMTDNFGSNSNICPTGMASAGMCTGEVAKKPLFIYAFNDNETEFFNFAIVHNPSDFDFSEMEMLWKVPQNGLGNVSHAYISSIPATINNEDGSMNLYVYTPANGIAGYKIYDINSVGVENIEAEDEIKINVVNRYIYSSVNAETITVYAIDGSTMLKAENTNVADASALTPGIYVVTVVADNATHSQQVVIK